MRVDGVERAGEAACDDVVKHLAADRAALARAADHDHRGRPEHVTDRGHRGDALALLEAPEALGPHVGRERDLDHVGLRAHADGISGLAEHADHAVVPRQDQRGERVGRM